MVDGLNPANTVNYTYDANGNRISKVIGASTTSYTYNVLDQLAATTDTNGSPVTFAYDYGGMRVKKIDSAGETRYLYDDGAGGPLAEYDGSGSTTARYAYGQGSVSRTSVSGGSRSEDFFFTDALGSTSELTNAAGVVHASYGYDASGNVVAMTGSDNPVLFTGQLSDRETGLQYFNSRYYDASTGTFLTRDANPGHDNVPISLNPYLYAYANPLRYTDPSGHDPNPTSPPPPPSPGAAREADMLFPKPPPPTGVPRDGGIIIDPVPPASPTPKITSAPPRPADGADPRTGILYIGGEPVGRIVKEGSTDIGSIDPALFFNMEVSYDPGAQKNVSFSGSRSAPDNVSSPAPAPTTASSSADWTTQTEWVFSTTKHSPMSMIRSYDTGNAALNVVMNKILLPWRNLLAAVENIPFEFMGDIDDAMKSSRFSMEWEAFNTMMPLEGAMGLAMELPEAFVALRYWAGRAGEVAQDAALAPMWFVMGAGGGGAGSRRANRIVFQNLSNYSESEAVSILQSRQVVTTHAFEVIPGNPPARPDLGRAMTNLAKPYLGVQPRSYAAAEYAEDLGLITSDRYLGHMGWSPVKDRYIWAHLESRTLRVIPNDTSGNLFLFYDAGNLRQEMELDSGLRYLAKYDLGTVYVKPYVYLVEDTRLGTALRYKMTVPGGGGCCET